MAQIGEERPNSSSCQKYNGEPFRLHSQLSTKWQSSQRSGLSILSKQMNRFRSKSLVISWHSCYFSASHTLGDVEIPGHILTPVTLSHLQQVVNTIQISGEFNGIQSSRTPLAEWNAFPHRPGHLRPGTLQRSMSRHKRATWTTGTWIVSVFHSKWSTLIKDDQRVENEVSTHLNTKWCTIEWILIKWI